MTTHPARKRWIVAGLLGGVLLLIGAASAALIYVNARVLPRVLATAQEAVAARSDYRLAVARLRYTPWYGVVADEISLTVPDGSDKPPLAAERVQLSLSVPAALRARSLLSNPAGAVAAAVARSAVAYRTAGLTVPVMTPQLPDPRASDAPAQLWHLATVAGDLAQTMGDVQLRGSGIRAGEHELETATLQHDPTQRSFLLDATGRAGMEVRVRMNYRDRLLETQFDATIRPADDRVLRGGQLAGELTVTGPERDMPPLETAMTGEIRITDLLVMAPVVAGEPIGPLSLRYAFGARLDPLAQPPDPASLEPLSRASELTNAASVIQAAAGEIPAFQGVLQITDGDLLVNGVETEFLPTLWGIYRRRSSVPAAPALLAAPAWIAVEGVVGPTSTQTLLEAIPTAIAGPLADAQVRGELSATVRYRLPLFAIVAMDWVAETELDGFAVTRIPAAMNPYKLNGEFLHTIVDPEVDFQRTVVIPERRPASMTWMLTHSEHTERQIRQMRSEDAAAGGSPPDVVRVTGTPPEPDPTYRYVYLDQMSRWIPAAVLTAEDGDFFFYGGVNPITLKAAIARNLEAGEVLYGASTISMQVAKMLFLDQERIFARKLQEVFLVYLMEHHVVVPKDRILELYLNLAEFGPGIFGVYDASAYYFGTHPREISAGEAAWLASILPAPKTYHRYFASGWISDGWWERMQSYLQIMLERGRISPAEFEAATEQRPVFRRP